MIIYDAANDKMVEVVPTSYILKKRFNIVQDDLLIFRHSHIAITNYTMGDNPEFEKALSVWDETRYKYRRVMGHYVQELKEFRVPRSFDTAILKQYFPNRRPIVENDAYPAKKIDIKLLTPPRDDEQRVGLAFLCSQGDYKRNYRYTTLMLDMSAGSGKAQPDDTMIPTARGLRRLDEIRVGDQVFNIHGKLVDVLGVYPQKGLQETYEVVFKDGRTTRCNPEHLWYVHDMNRTKPHRKRVMSLQEIMDAGIRKHSMNGHQVYRFRVEYPEPIQYKRQWIPVDPYVIGVLIGNGCLMENPLTISSGNCFVPTEIARILGCQVNFRRYGNYSYNFYFRDCDPEQHRNIRYQTSKFLKDIPDLIGSTSGTKFIPDIYKYNCIEVRKALIQGLMDTDGHISAKKYRLSYSTTSPRLKDDLVEVLRSLGYGVYVTEDSRDKYRSGHCYKLHIVCRDSEKPDFFRVNPRSVARAKRAAKYITASTRTELPIVEIRKVEPTPQRCIAIDDPLHVYITENYIPTHNTYTMSAASCFLQAKSVVIVPFSALLEQWEAAFVDHTSLTKNDILIIASEGSKKSSQDTCLEILDGVHDDKKVFIFMIDSLVAFQKKYGNLKTIELLRSTGAYVKIMDEIHREFTAMGMIDALSNFHMNYYASATPDRSQRKEKWIFRTVYRNCPRFGQNFKVEAEKWTNIVIARYAFTPTPQQIKRMVNPRKKWLNPKAYEKELICAPDDQVMNLHIVFRNVMKWSKSQLKKGNKILILCATIDGTAFMQEWAEEFFPGETSRYYGTMKKKEKEAAKKKTVICATSQSLGTGADIKGIQHVYNIETYTTTINAGQLPGRARKIEGVQVFYIEFVNMSYVKTYRQFESHKPYLIKTSKTGKLIMLE